VLDFIDEVNQMKRNNDVIVLILCLFIMFLILGYLYKQIPFKEYRLECEFEKKESVGDTLAKRWTGEYEATSKFVFIGLDVTNAAQLDSMEKTIDGFVFMVVTKDSITKQFTRNEFLSKIGFDTTATK